MMTEMSTEEVQAFRKRLREIRERIKAGKEPELVKKIFASLEERVLTKQSDFNGSPMERYERLFGSKKQR